MHHHHGILSVHLNAAGADLKSTAGSAEPQGKPLEKTDSQQHHMFGGGETSLGGRGGTKMEKTRKRKLWLDGCKLS